MSGIPGVRGLMAELVVRVRVAVIGLSLILMCPDSSGRIADELFFRCLLSMYGFYDGSIQTIGKPWP